MKKVELMYLGTDTEYFYPLGSPESIRQRESIRRQSGFYEQDLVCVYTGKLTEDKSVLTLAEAVERLRSRGEHFRGLFIGDGPLAEALHRFPNSKVLSSVSFSGLGPFYRAADIAVWPGTESISMLDAAACGLPVVISDQVTYRAPVNGNGKVFRGGDTDSLIDVLLELRDSNIRKRLGAKGAERMAKNFSWKVLAQRRLADYRASLEGGKGGV